MTRDAYLRSKTLGKWKRVAAAVHAHFGLSEPARRFALHEARRHPYRALRSYLAISASLR